MRILVPLIALATLAAGCISATNDGEPADPAAGVTGLSVNDVAALVHQAGDDLSGRLAEGVAAASFYIGHDAAEPTVAVTSDGTLFYAAITFENDLPTCSTPPPASACLPRTDILRSKDGGATWEDVTPYLPGGVVRSHPETGDPYVYVDAVTDRVFMLDQRMAVGQYSISWSDDLGESWTGPFFLCDAPPCDHQTIVSYPSPTLPTAPTYASALMVCYNQIAAVACKTSLDGGAAWTRATPPFRGVEAEGGLCGGLHGHLKASLDGVVYIPKEHCGKPMLATSKDGGVTWTTSVVAEEGASGPDPVVAVDNAGNVYYAFVNATGRLFLATSVDQGATWSPAVDVTPPGITATHLPAMVAGDVGRVALAFPATDDPEGYERDVEEPDALWHGYISILEDALSPTPSVVTVRVNPADDPLVRGVCGPGRCPAMYDFIDIVVDKEGRVWAAFSDGCIDDCVNDATVGNNALEGFVATLRTGPSLLAGASLPEIHGSA